MVGSLRLAHPTNPNFSALGRVGISRGARRQPAFSPSSPQDGALKVKSCEVEPLQVTQPHSSRDEIADEKLALRIWNAKAFSNWRFARTRSDQECGWTLSSSSSKQRVKRSRIWMNEQCFDRIKKRDRSFRDLAFV